MTQPCSRVPGRYQIQVLGDPLRRRARNHSRPPSQRLQEGLLQRLLASSELVQQTKVNSKKQFMESQDFQSAVTEAVADNQDAHNTMADYFFTDGPAINGIIVALADAFYETAIDDGAGRP